MKKLPQNFIIILAVLFLMLPAGAFELDWSADEEIRKNYQQSKLEQEVLPGLPSILKQETSAAPVENIQKFSPISAQPINSAPPKSTIETEYSNGFNRVKQMKDDSFTAIKIRKGTKFRVQSKTKVSDWNTPGARMTFESIAPVTQRYISVPAGTTFKGVIEDSHQPNGFGNGGLLKLKADSVILKGASRPVNAKVIRANDKIIFFNNIKGKRGYIRGIGRVVDKGENFYKKSRNTSKKLADNPVGVIISPIPTVVGAVGYAVNLVASPVTALWSKGDHISLPAGTNYVIKLKEHAYIY